MRVYIEQKRMLLLSSSSSPPVCPVHVTNAANEGTIDDALLAGCSWELEENDVALNLGRLGTLEGHR